MKESVGSLTDIKIKLIKAINGAGDASCAVDPSYTQPTVSTN